MSFVLPPKFPADPVPCKPVTALLFKCMEDNTRLELREVRRASPSAECLLFATADIASRPPQAGTYKEALVTNCSKLLEEYKACVAANYKSKRELIRVPETYRP